MTNISFRDHFQFDGDLFFEDNLSIDCDECVGTLKSSNFFHLPSSSIEDNGQGNRLYSTIVDQAPIADFDFSLEDSLINIAETVTVTTGNKILGNYKLENDNLDLSSFADNSLFIKGKAELEGVTISGGSSANPAFFITSGKLTLKGEHNRPTIFGDNIILIAKKKIEIKKDVQFGIDRQGMLPGERPVLCNEIFSRASIEIDKNSGTIWGQVISPAKKIVLSGNVFGGVYAPGEGLELSGNHAYLEGSLVASGISHQPEIKEGRMVLFGTNFFHFPSRIHYQLIPGSIIEY
ncbi:MAG: hypothetical protein GXO91_09110 [FCB group bacterium]|nr:hypothetical protein [FCB group bacterium]